MGFPLNSQNVYPNEYYSDWKDATVAIAYPPDMKSEHVIIKVPKESPLIYFDYSYYPYPLCQVQGSDENCWCYVRWLYGDRDYNRGIYPADIACAFVCTSEKPFEIAAFVLYKDGRPIKYWLYDEQDKPRPCTKAAFNQEIETLCLSGGEHT